MEPPLTSPSDHPAGDAATMVEIVTGSFRLGLLPGLGGSLTHLVWTPAGGPPST